MKNYITTFDPFFNRFFLSPKTTASRLMRTDVKENKDNYVMKVELPEIKKEDIKITLNNGYLNIAAVLNNEENEEEEENYIFRERAYGEYSRNYYVGEDIQLKDISAKLDNGVLKLIINKPDEEAKEKEHTINID